VVGRPVFVGSVEWVALVTAVVGLKAQVLVVVLGGTSVVQIAVVVTGALVRFAVRIGVVLE